MTLTISKVRLAESEDVQATDSIVQIGHLFCCNGVK